MVDLCIYGERLEHLLSKTKLDIEYGKLYCQTGIVPENSRHRIHSIAYKGMIVGFIYIDEIDDYNFISILEIFKPFRGRGFGRMIIQKLLKEYPQKWFVVDAWDNVRKFWDKFFDEDQFITNIEYMIMMMKLCNKK